MSSPVLFLQRLTRFLHFSNKNCAPWQHEKCDESKAFRELIQTLKVFALCIYFIIISIRSIIMTKYELWCHLLPLPLWPVQGETQVCCATSCWCSLEPRAKVSNRLQKSSLFSTKTFSSTTNTGSSDIAQGNSSDFAQLPLEPHTGFFASIYQPPSTVMCNDGGELQ